MTDTQEKVKIVFTPSGKRGSFDGGTKVLDAARQLGVDIDYTATTIPTSSFTNFTEGFPETNGLIKIGNEIIHYESIVNNSFINFLNF